MANFPPRKSNSLAGSVFINKIMNVKESSKRDELICQEILAGNFPDFLRKMVPIVLNENGNKLVYNAMPDYMSVGSDSDYVRVPLGAAYAQKIADSFGCTLPTPKISDQIWSSASVKLAPKPMSSMTTEISGKKYSPKEFLNSGKMTETDSFQEHNRIIQEQAKNIVPGQLVAGHKKDIVISNQMYGKKNRLGIHGLHDKDGKPIQGGALSPHSANYSDYSHGIRLIDRSAKLNGKAVDLIDDVAKNKEYAYLISNEGALKFTSYNESSGIDKNKQYANLSSENNGYDHKNEAPRTNSQGRLIFLDRIYNYLKGLDIT